MYQQILRPRHRQLPLHRVGDDQNEWLEIHLPEIEKCTNFHLGVGVLFILWCYEGIHLFINALTHTRLIVTGQRSKPHAWAIGVSRNALPGCLSSSRTSPSKCPCSQLGNEWLVSADSIPNPGKHPHISLFLCADRSLHMLGADGSVYVIGENASDPSYSTPKSLDIDNASQSTLPNSQAR